MKNSESVKTPLIIGLTGNIGSGKSSVRRMLEYSGALGIDADKIAQDALKKDSPAFPRLREMFGDGILNHEGEIDRKALGKIVFDDTARLKQLEEVVHPLVSKACEAIIAHSPLPVIVIEAIKLLESDLAEKCRSIWVVASRPDVVYQRLEQSRGMNRVQVDARLAQQSSIDEKKNQADVVIENSASSQNTWVQVQSALAALLEKSNHSGIPQGQPDLHSILPPSNASIQELRSILQRHPENLLNRILAASMTGHSDQDTFQKWHEDDNLVFQSLFHFHFTHTENIQLACWQCGHFSCTAGGWIPTKEKWSPKDLRTLLDRMESFGRDHLCRCFSIPIKMENVSFIRNLGYERQQGSFSFHEVYEKAGYNLYTKANPLNFKFF